MPRSLHRLRPAYPASITRIAGKLPVSVIAQEL